MLETLEHEVSITYRSCPLPKAGALCSANQGHDGVVYFDLRVKRKEIKDTITREE